MMYNGFAVINVDCGDLHDYDDVVTDPFVYGIETMIFSMIVEMRIIVDDDLERRNVTGSVISIFDSYEINEKHGSKFHMHVKNC